MRTDLGRGGSGGQEGAFGRLDPKLNVYALANGMDLLRGPSRRTLQWYRDGLERAIRIEVDPSGALSVTAACWSTDDPATERRAVEREGLSADELAGSFSAVLDAALARANGL